MARLVATSPQTPRQPYHQPLPPVSERLLGPASEFANLSPSECRRRLSQAGLNKDSFERRGPTNGVATPLRIVAPVGGVRFIVPPAGSPYGTLDCRQALLWMKIAPVLVEHRVASIRIDNFYRNRARIRAGKKSQHAYGLAADVVSITLEDGRVLDVEDDFLGKRGSPVCGPRATISAPPGVGAEKIEKAVLMRNWVCDLARRGAFHHILTPNYNAAHRDHLHLDIKRDNRWLSVD